MADEYDDLFDESGEAATLSAEEKGVPANTPSPPSPAPTGAAGVAASTVDSGAQRARPRVSAPVKTVEEAMAVIEKISDSAARGVKGQKGRGQAGKTPKVLPSASSGKKRKVVERGDGRCTAYAPANTKCKLCGKVHPV